VILTEMGATMLTVTELRTLVPAAVAYAVIVT
jgi:hypothetical protein